MYEGQNALTDTKTAFTLQAGRPDDHHISVVCYDARGNGEGGVAPTITGDHENRITDYTAVLCYDMKTLTESNRGVCGAITAGMWKGSNHTGCPVVLMRKKNESISEDNRSIVCEQPPRKLHGTGCLQRHAPGLQEER